MQCGSARWSLGAPGWSPPGAARGLPGGNRAQIESFRKFGKRRFGPLVVREGIWRAPPYIIARNQTPNGARQERQVLWNDDLAPFISDKIRAKNLDLGYGDALFI